MKPKRGKPVPKVRQPQPQRLLLVNWEQLAKCYLKRRGCVAYECRFEVIHDYGDGTYAVADPS